MKNTCPHCGNRAISKGGIGIYCKEMNDYILSKITPKLDGFILTRLDKIEDFKDFVKMGDIYWYDDIGMLCGSAGFLAVKNNIIVKQLSLVMS